jgi:hypothetical protein
MIENEPSAIQVNTINGYGWSLRRPAWEIGSRLKIKTLPSEALISDDYKHGVSTVFVWHYEMEQKRSRRKIRSEFRERGA